MRAHQADSGLVEEVEMALSSATLFTRYVRTGTAWRAKRYSDGRVAFYTAPPGGPSSRLTAREHEVAQLTASGLRSREIAAQLFVSVRTIDAHLRSAYAKTGTGSRVKLTNWLAGNSATPASAARHRPGAVAR